MAYRELGLVKLVCILLVIAETVESQRGPYKSIISFGDSMADTGNLIGKSDPNHPDHAYFPPYGQTYFHRPTGRHSDGRLIIDFIAKSLGFPYVPPYYGRNNGASNFRKGINLAVAGATAAHHGLKNLSLVDQLTNFKHILPTLCTSASDCKEYLGDSLILMGEIGGNDYNHVLEKHNKNIEEIKKLVPSVIQTISSAILELIEMGGKTFVVPGNFPIGCWTVYQTVYQNSTKEEYDPSTGCLTWLNQFSQYHNHQLQAELNRIQQLHPQAHIIYADYYNAALSIFQDPTKYGFIKRPFAACCGVGGPFNFTKKMMCGSQGTKLCKDPSKYVNWDGIHLTEAAFRVIAQFLLSSPPFTPPNHHSS